MRGWKTTGVALGIALVAAAALLAADAADEAPEAQPPSAAKEDLAQPGAAVPHVENTFFDLIRKSIAVLRDALAPEGFNVGTNLGRCAGAGVPDHFHAHVVPRWMGDTNCMAVLGDVRVVPDSLDALYGDLVNRAVGMGLRDKPPPPKREPP